MWTVGGWVSDPSYLGRDAGEGLGQQPVEGVGQPRGGQAAGQQEPDMIRIIFTGSEIITWIRIWIRPEVFTYIYLMRLRFSTLCMLRLTFWVFKFFKERKNCFEVFRLRIGKTKLL